MNQSKLITSRSNPLVKQVVRLRTQRNRRREERFLIEGYRELQRALESGVELETFLFCPGYFLGANEGELLAAARAANAQLVEVAAEVFAKLSYRDRPDGVLGIGVCGDFSLAGLKLRPNGLLLVAESIEKPGNLGTMLRSADGAGVSGLLLCDKKTDIFNPNVVRASLGCLFTVPLACAGSAEAISWLKAAGVTIVAATPHAEKEYFNVDYRGSVAVAIGSEQYGLSELWLAAADIQVQIPMCGSADSLNAAMAANIMLFEAQRQRLQP